MIDHSRPINLNSAEFNNDKFAWYEQIREDLPVHQAKVSIIKVFTIARYDDCTSILKDPRVLRNRSTITGGGRFPFPMPKAIKPIAESMIVEDDPNHRRLRELVRRAFRPQAIEVLETKIDQYSNELLDGLSLKKEFDLQSDYALAIPMRMIGDMMGLSREAIPQFKEMFSILTKGFGGWRIFRTLFWDMPDTVRFVRELIGQKRDHPGDDILTGLIEADAEGDRLTEDEIVAMVFLLIVGGYETTVHLITNGVLTLLENPEQLARLRDNPELINSAVEEILRHRGPVQSTKPGYAAEDIQLHGVTIPKGKPIMPLFGAANHDPRAFDNPQVFDIGRTPNRHLGFGHGTHFCLGAHLARAEARFGILNLLQRFPNLQLAGDPASLKLQNMPGWHRYDGLPVKI
ncbi:MAG: cytochrome P450 [Pseudomonadota bacterium]|nr:cytochrome P450 [Pseudomonadota bacterium]